MCSAMALTADAGSGAISSSVTDACPPRWMCAETVVPSIVR